MAEFTEAEIVRDLTDKAVRLQKVTPGELYAYRLPDGSVEQLDLSGELPAFKTGQVVVRDVASFAAYYAKHSDSASEVFADLDAATVTAVLDAHGGLGSTVVRSPRWQQHRLVLALTKTKPWLTWTGNDRQMMPQLVFAEFLEDNYADLAAGGRVKAADLLEIAQSFQLSSKTEFVSGERLHSGAIELTVKEDGTARAGRERKIEIPTEFDLAIAPYDDCDAKQVAARFRYRARNGELTLGYFLNQPDRHAEAAVKDIVAKVEAAIGGAVMFGVPSGR